MPKFIRFSRDIKLGVDRYFSRTWYQVPSALAKQYLDDYPDLAMQVETARPEEEVLAGRLEYLELEELAEEALEDLEAAELEEGELSTTELEADAQAEIARDDLEAADESVEDGADEPADVPPDEEGEDDDAVVDDIEDAMPASEAEDEGELEESE